MVIKNEFYIAKSGESTDIFAGYSWASGAWEYTENNKISSTPAIDLAGCSRFLASVNYTHASLIDFYFFDENRDIIDRQQVSRAGDVVVPSGAAYAAVEVTFTVDNTGWDKFEYTRLYKVIPHYKNVKKQRKKENGQIFFRESLEGKIILWGPDYKLVKDSSIEDKLLFYIYQNNSQYIKNEFNKTDCKFDHFKGSVELKLTPCDKYTKVLNDYEKTFDLIKLAIGKSEVQLTKRSIIQIYIQGENTVSNYAGGTYWEDEVTEAIDSQDELLKKYYFAKGPKFTEVSLLGFNYDINSAYHCIEGKNIWNGTSTQIVNGVKYKMPCSIKFTKVASAGDYTDDANTFLMSDGETLGLSHASGGGTSDYTYDFDSYRIEIYTGRDGTGTKIYQSESLYGNDSKFVLAAGQGLYKMVSIAQEVPNKQPEPAEFYLGENMIEYQIWGRLVCDVETSTDGTKLYDLPYDDFATERANFKKCIGLVFSQNSQSIIRIIQSEKTQEEPTPYGLTEYGEYFVKPVMGGVLAYRLHAYPLAKSTWGNTSLWIGFEEDRETSETFGMEHWSKKYYKKIRHRDCMEIGAVIKSLLNKIDKSIKFESTPEFSEFFYGTTFDNTYGYYGLKIYITQKSNILKGEYDQAAKKAEITLKQLMDMLCNCFRCYWFIDEQNRFRVEHIRYFMHGLSYSSHSNVQCDLTQKQDKFNKKAISYAQQEVTFEKSNLNSRYEFAWADDVTEAMGGGFSVNVRSNYIQQDKTENINIELFTSDVDYMMFAPSKFSQDGFALLIAKNGEIPIIYDEIYDTRDEATPMKLHIQNYYASFIDLFNNYLYDMPAERISTSVDQYEENLSDRYSVDGVKRCMEHDIELQSPAIPDMYKLIRTDVGDGYIDSVSTNIDSHLMRITLVYEPH